MMMDHHRFIKSNKNSNVMIGGPGSRSSSSDTGDDLTTRNSATQDDAFSNSSAAFDHNTNSNSNSNSNNNSFYGSSPQPASIFGDEAFDKINIDFDSTMANDLEFNNPSSHDVLLSSSKLGGGPASDTSVNSEMYLDKFIYSEPGSEPKGMTGVEDSKIGIDLKLGDIGDELDTELMSKFLSDVDNDSNITGGGVTKPSNGVTSMDPFMESGTQKLYQSPLFDFDAHNPLPTTSSGTNSNNVSVNNSRDNSRKSDSNSNTVNINISLKNGGSNGSLCDSLGSLPSISNIAPNEPFPTASQVTSNPMSISNNSNYNAQHQQQLQQQQQTSMQQQQQQHQLATRSQQQHVIMMQRQQQLFLQQQQQQQHQMRQQQEQQQQQQGNNNPQNSSISSIVNDQLSRLPQANELNKLGVAGLEQEKMKLINRLKQIERSGAPMNVGQQQDPHQQFVLQQQLLLRQHQQQQQQQSLRQGGIQGQINFQGQQQQGQHQTNSSFALNQQMIQQQNQGDMSGCGLGLNPRPMAVSSSHQQTHFAVTNTNMNMSNNSNNSTTDQLRQQQIQFANTTSFGSNNNNNNVGNSQNKNNVSSVMVSGGKETPLLSFLRNNKIKRGSNIIKNSSSSNSSNNIMSMPGQQQQQVAAPAHSNMNSSFRSTGSDILDAAPIDFSSSTNPLLRNQRNQMMNNLDRSVNRNNGVGGRFGGLAGRRGMSSQVRENMMQQMTDSNQLSKSCKELRTKKPSTDFYESAGIISRHASADNMLRRTSLTPGAAKAQNRRFSLGRSSNSSKLGGGSSSSSLPGGKSGGNSSSRSLTSMNSTENLFPVKRGTSGGRGGHGAKHKLGSGLSRRTSSVPYITSSLGESTSSIQQQMEDNHPSQQNDGWP